MKKEWVLFVSSGFVTICAALLLIRWLAPGLLGVPVDLQLVQVDKKIPPFFDNIFREEGGSDKNYLLQDPVTKVRAPPFFQDAGDLGPHDLLGFRNHHIPSASDIVVIGDSQTYGNNVPIDWNWPSITRKALRKKLVSIYNMSVGGWGAIQYYSMLKNAVFFQPRVIVVAMYTGNDPLESFALAYGSELHKEFRPEPSLTKTDAPPVVFPPPDEEKWAVQFKDGTKTVFTPTVRTPANIDHPAVRAGYEIMARAAEQIAALAGSRDIPVFFTIIPTKEFVYARKVNGENINPPREYAELISGEKQNIDRLRERILQIDGAFYVDVITPLQARAMLPAQIYPDSANGHPFFDGYFVIGSTIASSIDKFIPDPPSGLFYRKFQSENNRVLMLARNKKLWFVPSADIAVSNGWSLEKELPVFSDRDLAGHEYLGTLLEIDSSRFGPLPQ